MSQSSNPEQRLTERRTGDSDRRHALEDRRNAERVVDDPAPRRDPERAGRRHGDS